MRRQRESRHHWIRHTSLVVIAGACTITGCAGPAAVTNHLTNDEPDGSQVVLDAAVTPAVVIDTLPVSSITRLAANSEGAWVWLAEPGRSSIAHYRASDGLNQTVWSSADPSLLESLTPPALVACDDSVWFGINHHLVRIDDQTSTMYEVPDAPTVPAVVANRPDDIKATSGVIALGCRPGGLAVGVANSTHAYLFDAASGSFAPISLPEGTEVAAIAGTGDGGVAFGLQDYQGRGPHQVLQVDAQARVQERTVPDSTNLIERAGPPPEQANLMVAPAVLGDGSVVYAVDTGLLVVSPTGRSTSVPLGTSSCVPVHVPGETAAPSVADGCPVSARVLATDGGDVV